MKLQIEDVRFFANYIESQLGIIYQEDNYFQLENRLTEIARIFDLKTPQDLMIKAKSGISGQFKQVLLDVATNNETSFFRDAKVFKNLESTVLPELIRDAKINKTDLNIWSVASSSGQEAYSISILIQEISQKMTIPSVKIYSTDISERILKKAASGKYSQLEVQRGMPTNLLLRYFSKTEDENWQIKDEVRNRVEFKVLNLKSDPYLTIKFDLILCRNVLIYQKIDAKAEILKRLYFCLKPSGYLLMGSGESMLGFENPYIQQINEGIAYYTKIKKSPAIAA